MGIPLLIRIVDPDTLEMLKSNPETVDHFLWGPLDEIVLPKPEPPKQNFFQKMLGSLAQPTPVDPPPITKRRFWRYYNASENERRDLDALLPIWKAPEACDFLDMDKSYTALHYALTGNLTEDQGVPPLGCLYFGGTQVGLDENTCWSLDAGQVAELDREIAPITREELVIRLSEERIAATEILHYEWQFNGWEANLESSYRHFASFQQIVHRAVGQGSALIFWMAV